MEQNQTKHLNNQGVYNEKNNLPNAIYSNIFSNLIHTKMVYVLLSGVDENGKCNWSINLFHKYKNKVVTIVSNNLIDCAHLKEIKNLYQKLNDIEKHNSQQVAEKYLEGYLEYNNITLNQMFSKFLAVA